MLSEEEQDVAHDESVGCTRHQYRFLCGHPLFNTHAHHQRKRLQWTRYSGKRLPDLADLSDGSGVAEADRFEKRELYGQSVLILFQPFRRIEDLLGNGESWWSAYLRLKVSLVENRKTRTILSNIQDFYESFCREKQEEAEEHGMDNDFIKEMVKEDVMEEKDIHDGFVLDSVGASSESCLGIGKINEFASKLALYKEFPLTLAPRNSENISQEAANAAVEQMPAARSRNCFILPGRAQIGVYDEKPLFGVEESLLWSSIEDHRAPTRIDLMEKLAKALIENMHIGKTSNDGDTCFNLPINFPTIQDHSQSWGLNEEQHVAFVLSATALLKFISDSNELDSKIHGMQASRITKKISDCFVTLLHPSGQLIMFLGKKK